MMRGFSRLGSFTLAVLVFAMDAPASAACTSPHSTFDTSGPIGAHAETIRRPEMRSSARRPANAGSTSYAIDDVGEPPGSIYGQSLPVAFNNSGQIVGETGDPKIPGAVHCVMYVGGGVYRDISPSADVANCVPESMTSEDAKGNVRVVGYVAVTYAPVIIAFETTYSVPHDTTSMIAFGENQGSALSGINATGHVVGPGWYDPPLTGFFTLNPELIGVPGASKLVAAQPDCTVLEQGCGVDTHIDNSTACPFGGCSINAVGTILGCDLATGAAMTFAFGARSPGVDLPIVAANGTAPAINDAAQILYATMSQANFTFSAFVYSMASKATVEIPDLPGATDNVPLSINNSGRVLGFDGTTYWTWDPANGLQDIGAALPANAYQSIAALGINDDDRILVRLNTASAVHWGTLVPLSASSASRSRRRRTNLKGAL